MPTETNPYRLADKAIDLLNSRAVKRFEDAKDEAAQKGFDELNVLEVTRTLYDQLRKDNQDVFLELAQERYQEAEPHGEKPPDLAWLLALLAAYNAVTKVIYDNDVDRKRQYTAEGINSSTAKVTEFRRGLHYWADLTAGGSADDCLYKKVCETCRERNGKIYSINSIPPKPHRRCRCVYEPMR